MLLFSPGILGKLLLDFFPPWSFSFYNSFNFFIRNKLLLNQQNFQVYKGYTKKDQHQHLKEQNSYKSKKETQGKTWRALAHSSKEEKKKDLRSMRDRSTSSKFLAFLSLKMHHIKQCSTIFQIATLRCRPKLPFLSIIVNFIIGFFFFLNYIIGVPPSCYLVHKIDGEIQFFLTKRFTPYRQLDKNKWRSSLWSTQIKSLQNYLFSQSTLFSLQNLETPKILHTMGPSPIS